MNKQTDLSAFNNEWYKPGGSLIKRVLWYVINACIINTFMPFSGLKLFLLKLFGAKIGNNALLKPNVNIKYPWHLNIGNNVWIGEGVWIDNLTTVTIGNNVCISQGAMLLCGNHNYKVPAFDLIVKPIVLEDGVWVGAKATVCPDSHIKSHSIVTVGSVISGNTDAYSIYSGNKAVKIKDRIIN